MTEHEAGRELDALVAEKVTGYAWERDGDDYALMRVPGTNQCAMEINRGERYYALLPRFSTDIAAAWEVVDAMRQRGFAFKMFRADSTDDSAKTWAAFAPSGSDIVDETYAEAPDDTAPLAICRAALAAVGEAPENG